MSQLLRLIATSLLKGSAFGIGLLGTALLRATVSGTIKTDCTAGGLISASQINSNFQAINDTLTGLPDSRNANSARVLLNAGESVTSATDWIITFDSEQFDTNNMYDPGTANQITIQQSGMYLIHGRLEYSSNAAGIRHARLYHNGGTIADTTKAPSTAGNTFVSITTIRSLSAGDTVQLGARQTSGGNLTTVTQEFFVTRFCGV